jgi:TolB-like protein/class 3 adenylate cyclase
MENNRQLAAILFADIAGFTALVQKNERDALSKLNHFRSDVEEIVPSFSGTVIQFYGDGCLLIFQSVVQAIRCAIALQKSLKNKPAVPVRMGVHQGDIVMEDGYIFGDSVNIAARIESMSIPGAVLFSDSIQRQLKNQSDIQLVSLGSFEFKNVDHPMEVFAIVQEGFPVPKESEITGKFKSQNTEKSIAVLAFENRSSDPEQEYFSDGIAEEIIYGLSKLENLKVAGRASSFSFKNTKATIRDIGEQLNVETILEGSIRKIGNKVRITAQLVNAVDGFQIWTERFDRELEDIFAIQDEIAEEVVHKMKLTLLGKEKRQPLISRKTENVKAFQLYLQGRSYLDQRINIDAALSCFNRAVELDSNFASAHTSIAYAYFYKVVFSNCAPNDGFPKAEVAVQKALSIDSTIAEAHTMQGLIDFYFHYAWEKARQQYERAILLNPALSDTYRVKAYFHNMLLEKDTSIALAEKAYQMEPLSFNNSLSLADLYCRVGRYSDAIRILTGLIDKYPDNLMAKEMLGATYFANGDIPAAQEIFSTPGKLPQSITHYTSARYVFALENGEEQPALDYLEHMQKMSLSQWVQPSFLALLLFYFGREEEAVLAFQKAVEHKDPGVIYCNVDPLWARFRAHPVVREAILSIGLPFNDPKN